MKKKITGAVAVFAIVAMAAFNINVNNNDELSGMTLANIEALASGETGESGTGECWKTITEQAGSRVLYCGSCKWMDGAKSWVSGKGTC